MSYIGNQPATSTSGTGTIADGSVTTLKLANGSATLAKLDTTGSSGLVLTAQGAGVAPVWAAASGGLLAVGMLTASGVGTIPAGCTKFLVEVLGGGGGGGGVGASLAGDAAGGGAAGGYAMKLFAVTPGQSYTYTIGAAGNGGVGAADGSAGGTTSITIGANTVSCFGGAGGRTSTAAASATGGTAAGGDINLTGMSGSTSTATLGADTISFGGDARFGFGEGGKPLVLSGAQAGVAAFGFGSGGGGARMITTSTTAQTGGAGAPGVIRYWAFA